MQRSMRWYALPLLTVAFACSDPSIATEPQPQFKPAPSADLAVTSVIADNDASIADALQLRSDGLGSYRNASSVSSIIQSIGAWVMDVTASGTTRKVYVDFSQPIAGSAPGGTNPVAIPSGLYKVHIISKCNLYGVNMRNIAPGTTVACPLHIGQITVSGVVYALQMNPVGNSGDVAYPTTSSANITCTVPASGTGPCTTWRITPSGSFTDANGVVRYRNVAKLLKPASGKNPVVDRGDFYVSFAITVSNP